MTTVPSALLRIADPALGLYFRPGRNDHTTVLAALAGGPPAFQGAVLDASHEARHRELRLQLKNRGYEVVLDPMTLELATEGGWERDGLRSLEWAGKSRHVASQFVGGGVADLADPVAKFAVEKRYSGVLAPTHYVDGFGDPWWKVDRRATTRLRTQLDSAGRSDVPIYYRLAIARQALLDHAQRLAIVHSLADLPIDAVWLCLHPVSSRSGPIVLRSYLEICHDLAAIGRPLVAERAGFLGLALLGFNAVGAIESGISLGQSFDIGRLVRPPKKRDPDDEIFGPQARVYLERLGITLTRKEAASFFEAKGMKRRFACQDRNCCRSWRDMIDDPRRHFIYTRASEVAAISSVPAHDRPTMCLDWIRNASDAAVHAARFDRLKFEGEKRRLDGWRMALTDAAERREFAVSVRAPDGRRASSDSSRARLH